jgi:DNA-directed RNA polymerase subunit RPC12/RpoP
MNKRCTTHQYRKIRQKPSDRLIYRCMNCAHYITPEFLLGRQSLCWGCKKPFSIDQYASERTYPKCDDCRNKITPFVKPSEELLGPSISVKEELPESDNVVADILKRYGI